MFTTFPKIARLPACCLLSITVHVLSAYAVGLFGHYDFAAAVKDPPAVTVDLAAVSDAPAIGKDAAPEAATGDDDAAASESAPADEMKKLASAVADPAVKEIAKVEAEALAAAAKEVASAEEAEVASPADADSPPEDQEVAAAEQTQPAPEQTQPAAEQQSAPVKLDPSGAATAKAAVSAKPSTAAAGVMAFIASKYEKLSYRITMHGIPVATAELEAKNEQGMTSLTMRVKSNPAVSSVFPVDNVIESQQIGGLYLMTKIKQHEGNFRSDETFTINLRKKTVTWFDLVNPRITKTTVPTDDVLDTLSGIYYLRNRKLQVGKTETLHIFDSEIYADVPVEVLRREEVRLPNLSKVSTLVVRPLQKSAGIFRRTGDVLIWMTDDQSRVPVRIETSIALGKVTAELVNAESKPHGEEQREASR
jgi:hypothetical protein